MSVRHLDRLLAPRSLAVIGASQRRGSLGQLLARNLIEGGFRGPVWPVHPRARKIEGQRVYPDVAALPEAPELAVIATPPDSVPGLISELGARGTKAAVVITAGFGEGGNEAGARRRAAMLEAAQPHTLRIVGPNCLGLMVPGIGLNASFSHLAPESGDLAFVTQSGAIVTAMLDWAKPRGIGFSRIVSLGDMADVDFGDLLDFLASDRETRAILLYVEAISHARKFMSAARIAARSKPVIVIKGGRHEAGARAASSHTGALAGSDAVYNAAFKRAGLLRVFTLEELFDAAETLATASAYAHSSGGEAGDRLLVLTNGGGLGVLASDAVIDEGGRLTELSDKTRARLGEVLPPTWSRGNPIDIIGDADAGRYAAALEILLTAPEGDGVLVLNCPTAIADSSAAAKAVISSLKPAGEKRKAGKPVFAAWVGEETAAAARRHFAEAGVPNYQTPEQAARAFMHLVRYRQGQHLLMQVPPSLPRHMKPDSDKARAIVRTALAGSREWLSEPEAKEVLACYGFPVVPTVVVSSAEEAGAAAGRMGGTVALKILSPDITHKSDVGGVLLDLETPGAVVEAAETMRARVAELRPDARLAGFTVQQMARRPDAHELILGILDDRSFGPTLLFGQGGKAVEVIDDKALALPPLNATLARALIAETRAARLLAGYRDRPAADLDAIVLALVNLSQLACDIAEISELDINPLLADSKGVVVLDARIRVRPPRNLGTGAPPTARLAIRPYPKELEVEISLADGKSLQLRPIRPEDAPHLQRAFLKLTAEDVWLRFFAHLSELSAPMAARLTQIDYDREMALIALDPDVEEPDIWGVVRLAADPDNERAEFAVIVRSDVKGRGLGHTLMTALEAYARKRGLSELWGDVLAENQKMLELVHDLGYASSQVPGESGVLRVAKKLET